MQVCSRPRTQQQVRASHIGNLGLIVKLHPRALDLQTDAFCRFLTSINSLSAVLAIKGQTSSPSSSPNCLNTIAVDTQSFGRRSEGKEAETDGYFRRLGEPSTTPHRSVHRSPDLTKISMRCSRRKLRPLSMGGNWHMQNCIVISWPCQNCRQRRSLPRQGRHLADVGSMGLQNGLSRSDC